MWNEFLLIGSLFVIFGGLLLFYRLFGIIGIYCWSIFATIAANIEVLLVVDAFGMEQTLGNVIFASTFLATDILSEVAGKKEANRAVPWAWSRPSLSSSFRSPGCYMSPPPTTGPPPVSPPSSKIPPGSCWPVCWSMPSPSALMCGSITSGGPSAPRNGETANVSSGCATTAPR